MFSNGCKTAVRIVDSWSNWRGFLSITPQTFGLALVLLMILVIQNKDVCKNKCKKQAGQDCKFLGRQD